MRLFTTRSRRPDRPPAVRSLDLAALAAGHGRVTAGSSDRIGASTATDLVTALSIASGVPLRNAPCTSLPAPTAAGGLEIVAIAGDRRLAIGFGPETRRGWLALVLGLPSGPPAADDLAELPSPFERSLLARTLVEPLARSRWARDAGRTATIERVDVGEPRPLGAREARDARGTADRTVLHLVAAGPAGPVDLSFVLAEPSAERPSRTDLDRAILSASLPLVVTLDPDRAGVSLRAADLARFEPGDVLLTDLPADEPTGLPVTAAVRSGFRSPSPDRTSPGFPDSPTPRVALQGRLGTAGGRRGVRFEVTRTGDDFIR